MRILLLHVDYIAYETVKPALRNPPDPPGRHEEREAVVAYVTVEAGDDAGVVEAAATEIVRYAGEQVGAEAIVLYPYAHLSSRLEKPRLAHKRLVELERLISQRWSGRLHRAPFGWYKAFTVKAKGHPLAELSREFHPGTPGYRVEGRRVPLEEAIQQGLIPRLEAHRPRLVGLAEEKLRLLGLTPAQPGWMARVLLERLERWLHQGPPGTLEPAGTPERLGEAIALYARALELDPGETLDPGLAWRIAVVEGDPGEALSILSRWLPQRLRRLPLCGGDGCIDAGVEGELIAYEAEGQLLPIAAVSRGKAAVGPLWLVAAAIIDAEARAALGGDWVPRLPAWLHPVTVYLVPAPGAEEYARTLATDLARSGVNVVLDESTRSLGPRIRAGGRLWAPIVAVVGRREAETGTVTVRRRWEPGGQETLTAPALLEEARSLLHAGRVAGVVVRIHGS